MIIDSKALKRSQCSLLIVTTSSSPFLISTVSTSVWSTRLLLHRLILRRILEYWCLLLIIIIWDDIIVSWVIHRVWLVIVTLVSSLIIWIISCIILQLLLRFEYTEGSVRCGSEVCIDIDINIDVALLFLLLWVLSFIRVHIRVEELLALHLLLCWYVFFFKLSSLALIILFFLIRLPLDVLLIFRPLICRVSSLTSRSLWLFFPLFSAILASC